jgi:hypothetical protein
MSPRRSVLFLVVFLGGACSTAGGSTEKTVTVAEPRQSGDSGKKRKGHKGDDDD